MVMQQHDGDSAPALHRENSEGLAYRKWLRGQMARYRVRRYNLHCQAMQDPVPHEDCSKLEYNGSLAHSMRLYATFFEKFGHAATVLTITRKFLTYQIFRKSNPRYKIEGCQFKSQLEDFRASKLRKTTEMEFPAVQGQKSHNLTVLYKSTPPQDGQSVFNKHGVIFTDYKRAYHLPFRFF